MRKGCGILVFAAVLGLGLSAGVAYAQDGGYCPGLPCQYTAANGWDFDIMGSISQTPTSATADTDVYINGALFGSLHMDVNLLDNGELQLSGDISRQAGNIAGLPPLQIPFEITGPADGDGVIPVLDADQALVLSVVLTTLDAELAGLFEDTVLTSSPPECDDHVKPGRIQCDGPITGVTNPIPLLPPVPLPNSEDIEECCQRHDICFLNGGAPECEDVCDSKFRKCVEALTPWYSYPYTQLVLAFFVGPNKGFRGTTDKNECRCQVDVDRYYLPGFQDADYDTVIVGDKVCCEQDKCEEIDCLWTLWKNEEQNWLWKGKCKTPPQPDGKGGCE